MAETFKEICKMINESIIHHKTFKSNSEYDENELFYLVIWKSLENLSFKLNLKRLDRNASYKDDLYLSKGLYIKEAFDDSMINRRINEMGLIQIIDIPRKIEKYRAPQLFDGYLDIDNNRTNIKSYESKLALNIIDTVYRYCKIKPHTTIMIHLKPLKGFGNIYLDNEAIPIIKYGRNTNIVKKDLWLCQLNAFHTREMLYLLDITPSDFINMKIDAFMRGRVGSYMVFHDLVYASKLNTPLNIDVTTVLSFLEDVISGCNCDKFSYKLYCYIGFLLKIKKVTASQNNTKYGNIPIDQSINYPIMQNNDIPNTLFIRLSFRILSFISSNKVGCIQAFIFYTEQGIKLNNIFINRVFNFYSNHESLVDKILKMNLSENSHNLDRTLRKVCSAFSHDLNDVFKHNGDVDELYNYLFHNFTIFKHHYRFIDVLFEDISEIHRRRIKNTNNIEELKLIHRSMNICEKEYGKKSEKTEKILKEKVFSILKAQAK